MLKMMMFGAAHHPRGRDAARHPQHDDDLRQAAACYRHDGEQQQQPRDRHPGVDKALHRQVQSSASIARNGTDQDRYDHSHTGCSQTDQ